MTNSSHWLDWTRRVEHEPPGSDPCAIESPGTKVPGFSLLIASKCAYWMSGRSASLKRQPAARNFQVVAQKLLVEAS